MITYKLFRVKNDKLYPLYVEADREVPIGKWQKARIGEKVDDTHVKARALTSLSLRPGWHSTETPFTDWIGQKQPDGTLAQRPNTVWCECEVRGDELTVTDRYGSRELLNGWYYFKTNSKQREPWIISSEIKINKILTDKEIDELCRMKGIEPQKRAES